MKRFGWILVLLLMASPAWAAKKTTVEQLKDLLASLQQSKKSDAEVAAELKQIELTEELTRDVMNKLGSFLPGQQSLEQIYVLEAKSAVLAPPAADIPSTPAPDAAAQKAILDKATDYAAKVYGQLPSLTATKTSLRFQDNTEHVSDSSGMNSGGVTMDPNLVSAAHFVHLINTTKTEVAFEKGAEKLPDAKDKTRWGANGYLAIQSQGPVLSAILAEAQAAGRISWLRWETVNGKTTAVFAFVVDKKKSHYAVNYCCFPDTEQAGKLQYSMAGAGGGGAPSSLQPSASGNLQTATSFDIHFKNTIPYHGEIFVDPDTGIVVRLVTQADLKNSDLVHQEDQRIDYGPATVGGKALVVPLKTIINTEAVPNGDTGAGKFITRRTIFTVEYKNYATQ